MRNIIAFVLIVIVLSSCQQLRPFTEDLRKEYGWSEDDLKYIQFYLSKDVVLRRTFSGGKSEIQDGKIKVVDGRKVDEIVIPENTPGVLLFMPKSDRFAISFENEGENKFLIFGPNERMSNRYTLLGAEWNREAGIVTYNGEKYSTPTNSAFTTLLVDLKSVKKYEKKRHVATGRKVN